MFKSDPPHPREFQNDRVLNEKLQEILVRLENLEKQVANMQKPAQPAPAASSELEDMMFDEEGNPIFF